MSKITEKAAYIKGLADGMNIDDKGEQGKVLRAMIEALEEMAAQIEGNTEAIGSLEETLDTLSDDVADLEEVVYELDDDAELVQLDDDDDDFVEVQCPSCGDTIYYDAELVESGDDLVCPSCSQPVILAQDEEE